MTVSSTATRAAYNGNGVTTAFAVPFAYLSTGDVKVYVGGVLQSTGYTVSAAPAASGTVTFSVAPVSGTGNVVITRATTQTQEINFVANDPFSAATSNLGFDRAMLAAQDNAAGISRALRVADHLPPIDPVDLDNVTVAVATPATQAQAEAGTNNTAYLTSLTGRAGMKTAALTPDVDSDGYYNGESGSGFFADYNCLGGAVWRPDLSASQASISGGGIRDGFAILARDTDTTDYTAIGRKISNGARILMTGAFNSGSGSFDAQAGKDIVGLDVHAIANVSGPDRGVSAIAVGAVNEGDGIISNEFSVENPAAAAVQSVSMAAVQGIVRPYKAADGVGASYSAFLATNTGHRATAAFRAVTAPISGSYNGRFRYGMDFTDATIEDIAIRLRGTSASGNVATTIEYDANDYSYYDRASNRYGFVIGGNVPLLITSTGLNLTASGGNPIIDYDSNDYQSYDKTNNRLNLVIGGTVVGGFNAGGVYAGVGAIGNTSAFLNVSASTTSVASIYLPAGSAPSSPVDGQMWRIGAVLYLRDGGTTKSVTFA